MKGETRVWCVYKSSQIPDKYAAWVSVLQGKCRTFEMDMSYPDLDAVFLPDTISRHSQWSRKNNYFGQSISGTDFPDRFIVSMKRGEG